MNIWGGRGAMTQESVDFVTQDREVAEIEQLVVSAFISGDSSNFFELSAVRLHTWLALSTAKKKPSKPLALDQAFCL